VPLGAQWIAFHYARSTNIIGRQQIYRHLQLFALLRHHPSTSPAYWLVEGAACSPYVICLAGYHAPDRTTLGFIAYIRRGWDVTCINWYMFLYCPHFRGRRETSVNTVNICQTTQLHITQIKELPNI
jgi:hypothetical protein